MALQRLSRNDTEHVGGTDIRGWSLDDPNGQEIGHIEGLLYDTDDQRVKYAIAAIHERQVLVPVNMLELEEGRRRVAAKGYTRDMLLAQRPYDEDIWDESEELHHYRTHVPEHPEGHKPNYHKEPFIGKHNWGIEGQPRIVRETATFASAEPTGEDPHNRPNPYRDRLF